MTKPVIALNPLGSALCVASATEAGPGRVDGPLLMLLSCWEAGARSTESVSDPLGRAVCLALVTERGLRRAYAPASSPGKAGHLPVQSAASQVEPRAALPAVVRQWKQRPAAHRSTPAR